MYQAHSPYAITLSENNFSLSKRESVEVHNLPLYAAHCIGADCLKAHA